MQALPYMKTAALKIQTARVQALKPYVDAVYAAVGSWAADLISRTDSLSIKRKVRRIELNNWSRIALEFDTAVLAESWEPAALCYSIERLEKLVNDPKISVATAEALDALQGHRDEEQPEQIQSSQSTARLWSYGEITASTLSSLEALAASSRGRSANELSSFSDRANGMINAWAAIVGVAAQGEEAVRLQNIANQIGNLPVFDPFHEEEAGLPVA